jgi:methionine sulfoxide reductase heme-binding subunit
MKKILLSKWTKVVLFVVCLIPAAQLAHGAYVAFTSDPSALGSNPLQTLEHTTGDWTLRFLAITLAVTPLKTLLKQPQLVRFRRMLGLFAFFYAFAHFSIYLGLDRTFDLGSVWGDVVKRPYITVGFAGFVLMIPLAVTSTAGMVRRMGFKKWQFLHRAIYISAVLGVIHFYWLVKSDVREPLMYGGIMAVLLAWRVVEGFVNKRSKPSAGRVVQKEPSSAVSD